MSSAPSTDLTARARIREVAIRRIAIGGPHASLRAIATDAGVSAGLILHHFSSRAGLIAECDAHVLEQIRKNREAALDPRGGAVAFLAQLAQVEGHAPLVGYVMRCLQAGGPVAASFVEQLVADGLTYLENGVAAGTIRPSRDPAGRARLLVEQTLGALMLQPAALDEELDLEQLPVRLRAYVDRIIGPLLELYSEGLLSDSSLLDAYTSTRKEHQ